MQSGIGSARAVPKVLFVEQDKLRRTPRKWSVLHKRVYFAVHTVGFGSDPTCEYDRLRTIREFPSWICVSWHESMKEQYIRSMQ